MATTRHKRAAVLSSHGRETPLLLLRREAEVLAWSRQRQQTILSFLPSGTPWASRVLPLSSRCTCQKRDNDRSPPLYAPPTMACQVAAQTTFRLVFFLFSAMRRKGARGDPSAKPLARALGLPSLFSCGTFFFFLSISWLGSARLPRQPTCAVRRCGNPASPWV